MLEDVIINPTNTFWGLLYWHSKENIYVWQMLCNISKRKFKGNVLANFLLQSRHDSVIRIMNTEMKPMYKYLY